MKVRSQVFPTTNIVPSRGGDIYLLTDLFDDNITSSLSPFGLPDGLTYVADGSSDVIYSGGKVEFSDDATELWYFSSELRQGVQVYRPYLVDIEDVEFAGEEFFLSLDVVDTGTGRFKSILVSEGEGASKYGVKVEEYDPLTDSIVDSVHQLGDADDSVAIYIYITNTGSEWSAEILVATHKDMNTSFVESFEFGPFNHYPSDINIGIGLSGVDGTKIISPRLEDPIDIRSTILKGSPPIIKHREKGRLYLETVSAAPGIYEIVAYRGDGSGTIKGSTFVEVRDINVLHEPPKFLVSHGIETLTDESPILVCRDIAIPHASNQGSLSIHQECICSDELDLGKTSLEVVKGGRLHRDSDSGASEGRFEFNIVEEGAADDGSDLYFGQSLDLIRIHTDAYDLDNFQPGKELSQLRCLQLDNGDRFYYGVVTDSGGVTIKARDITLHSEAELINEFKYKLDSIFNETGDVVDDAEDLLNWVDIQDASGVHYMTFNNASLSLDVESSEGTYNLFDFDMVSRYISGPGSITSGYGELPLPGRGRTGPKPMTQRDYKYIFDAKPHIGRLVAFHYSRCNDELKEITRFKNFPYHVSTRSDSLSAIQISGSEIAICFKKLYTSSGGIRSDATSTGFSSVKVNIDNGGVDNSVDHIISGPSGFRNTYAFDVVRTGEFINLFSSYEVFDNYIIGPNLSDSVRYQKINIEAFDFDNGSRILVEDLEVDIDLPGSQDLENLLDVPEVTFNSTYKYTHGGEDHWPNMKFHSFSNIKASYSEERGQFVLALLTARNKLPVIVVGGDRTWEPLILAPHFNLLSGGPRNIGHRGWWHTGIDSFAATFANDGMIYTVATKLKYTEDTTEDFETGDMLEDYPYNFPKRSCEMGIVDLDKDGRWIGNESYVKHYEIRFGKGIMDEASETFELPTLNLGRYKFRTIPILNNYPHGVARVPKIDIESVDGYLVITYGTPERVDGLIYPTIYQSFHGDSYPFEVPMDAIYPVDSPNNNIIIGTDSAPEWYGAGVKISAKAASQVNPEYFDAAFLKDIGNRYLGHRFKVVVKSFPENGVKFSEDLGIIVGDIDDTASAFISMRLDGERLSVYVNNDTMEQVICGIDISKDVEINVLSKINSPDLLTQTGSQGVTVKVVVKQPFYSSGSGTLVMRSIGEVSFISDGVARDNNFFVISSNFYNVDTNPSNDYVIIKELSYGSLAPTRGYLSRVYKTSDYAEGIIVTQTGLEFSDNLTIVPYYVPYGKTWRKFSDVKLLSNNSSDPAYNFRVGELSEGAKSSGKYIWPNGIKFHASGDSAHIEDTFSLGRDRHSGFSGINTFNLHGNYISNSDLEDVVIWMDSESEGLPHFEFDSLAIKGTNVPELEVVVRDDDSEDWEVVEVIDLRRMTLPGDIVNIDDSLHDEMSEISYQWGLLDEGHFSKFDTYIYPESGAGRAAKVVDVGNDKLWTTNLSPVNDNLIIYSTRCFEKFNEIRRHRYVGIRFKPFMTYEGGFTLENFSIGLSMDMPLEFNHDRGTGVEYLGASEYNFVFDEQPYSTSVGRVSKTIDLSYSIANSDVMKRYVAMLNDLAVSRVPVWYSEGNQSHPDSVYLVLVDGDINVSTLIDEDGDEYYTISLTLRSIE